MDPRFSQQAGDGIFFDPNTGEIFDSHTGETFSSADSMMQSTASSSSQQDSKGGVTGAQAGGAGGSLLTAYMLSQMMKPGATEAAKAGADAAAATAPTAAAEAGKGLVQVGTNLDGTPMMGPEVAPEASSSLIDSLGSTGVVDAGLPGGPVSIPGIAAGAYTGYQQGRGFQNIIKDKKPTWLQHAMMFPMTFGADVLARPFLGNGKDKDQRQRDSWRGGIKENAPDFFDPETTKLTLSSGATLDWGKDGRNKLQNAGQNIDGRSDRHYYDVDFSRGDSSELAALADPFGRVLGGGSDKAKRDATGYLVNTAQQSGDPYKNLHEEADKLGLDYDAVRNLINEMDISQEDKDVHFNALDDFFGRNAYANKGPAWTRNHQQPPAAVAKPAAAGTPVVKPGARPMQTAPVTPTPVPKWGVNNPKSNRFVPKAKQQAYANR